MLLPDQLETWWLRRLYGALEGRRHASLQADGEPSCRSISCSEQNADWWGSRRREEAPWFALVGMIADRPKMDARGRAIEKRDFVIGTGGPVAPEHSGWLYGYANDAWQFHGNNRGQLRLTVGRH